MAQQVKTNETTATKRRVQFFLVSASDGKTPYTGAGGRQPCVSVNGAAWTTTGIGTLVAIGNGVYYADVSATLLTAHAVVQGFYGASPGYVDTNVYATPSLNSLLVSDDDPYSFKSDFTLAALWAYSSRTLTALGAGAVNSIWDQLTSAITGVGSIGKQIKDNLDVVVSTRSDFDEATNAVKLSATGLDDVTVTETTGRAGTLTKMVVALYMRFFNKVEQSATAQTLYLADDATPAVTGAVGESAGTQTKGKLS